MVYGGSGVGDDDNSVRDGSVGIDCS